jgi:hypothetical protein
VDPFKQPQDHIYLSIGLYLRNTVHQTYSDTKARSTKKQAKCAGAVRQEHPTQNVTSSFTSTPDGVLEVGQ